MELSVIETIWSGLWARNCANIQQVLILLPSGRKSFQVFREMGPWPERVADNLVLRVLS